MTTVVIEEEFINEPFYSFKEFQEWYQNVVDKYSHKDIHKIEFLYNKEVELPLIAFYYFEEVSKEDFERRKGIEAANPEIEPWIFK